MVIYCVHFPDKYVNIFTAHLLPILTTNNRKNTCGRRYYRRYFVLHEAKVPLVHMCVFTRAIRLYFVGVVRDTSFFRVKKDKSTWKDPFFQFSTHLTPTQKKLFGLSRFRKKAVLSSWTFSIPSLVITVLRRFARNARNYGATTGVGLVKRFLEVNTTF